MAADASPVSPQTQHSTQTPGTQSEEGGSEKGDEEDSYRIDKQLIMQNLENRTVVLIRNIPNRYKLEDLEQVIAAHVHGRAGGEVWRTEKFTILRLPIDVFTKRNLGYAFVNFSDSHEVLKLFLEVGTRKAFESRWTGSYGRIRIA